MDTKVMNVALKDLQRIPGVGKVIAKDLYQLGFKSVADLKGQDPEKLYIRHNDWKKEVQDICMLYTFRCAVYFAETPSQQHELEKLKWWYWMDKIKVDSKTKDAELRNKK
jgi:nucleotidyltransferase/DNA polymerase involved in DNA repair